MKECLVSVITPSYNKGDFIERTILSIKDQDYPNIEHIIIDGGSTDNTTEIIRRHAKSYNLNWVSEPDRGQSHAINKGFRLAKGDIVAYLNADDTYANESVISAIVSYFREDQAADMIYGNYNFIDRSGQVIKYIKPPEFSGPKLLKRGFIPQPAVFLRKNILNKTGLLDESLNYAMDLDLWFRIYKAGGIIKKVDLDIANFRLHPNSKTVSQGSALLREGYFKVRLRYSKNFPLIAFSFLNAWAKSFIKRKLSLR